MTPIFRPVSATSFTLGDDQVKLASVEFHIYSAGMDLLDGADLQNGTTSKNTTYQINSTIHPGLIVRLSTTVGKDNYLQIESILENKSTEVIQLDSITFPSLRLDPIQFPAQSKVWTMQGAAVAWGQDFAFELPIPFKRDNYLGHLQDAEGGGIPINYFWTPERGVAMMHLELEPQEWYLPVIADKNTISTFFELRRAVQIEPGQSFKLPDLVISIHSGDFFEPLALYRQLMITRGQIPAQPTSACFEPGWCSWGYEFDVTAAQMIGVLPVLKELNIHWLTLDDRWFDMYGDWNPRSDTFPGGGEELRRMNDKIHALGGFNQIWWYPLCAEDGHGEWESHKYQVSKIIQEHPDWVVLDEYGQIARNNRHLAMICPAIPEVQLYTQKLVETFITNWGFDGHKLDNIYTMPACHNLAHHHSRPEESIEAFGKVYKQILDLTRQLRPNSVTQICPCGTPMTHNLIPAADQTVTADPTSSAQIRQRIKFYKALMGERSAVFADHVELSDGSRDFASEIGTGGVPATKFVYPADDGLKATLKEYWDFPSEKQTEWKNWFDIYNRYRLAEGDYLDLYDTAFERPEAHAICKDGLMYYAFYALEFSGELEFRGLKTGKYQIVDYISGKKLGWINTENPKIRHTFCHAALLVAIPSSISEND